MEKHTYERPAYWKVTIALILAILLLMRLYLLSNYIPILEGIVYFSENIVFMGILGVAVLGLEGYRWLRWILTLIVSVAGGFAENELSFSYSLFIRINRSDLQLGRVVWNLAASLIVLIIMALVLYGFQLKGRACHRHNPGWRKWFLCLSILGISIGISTLAEWYRTIYFENLPSLSGAEDPLAQLFLMLSRAAYHGMDWTYDINRAVKLVVKALFVWMAAFSFD